MRSGFVSTEKMYEVAVACRGNLARTGEQLKLPRSTVFHRLNKAGLLVNLRLETQGNSAVAVSSGKTNPEKISVSDSGNTTEIHYVGSKISTEAELIEQSGIDASLYEIERVVVNNWEVAGSKKDDSVWKTGLKQIKITLRRKQQDRVAVEALLKKLEAKSPVVPAIKYPKGKAVKHSRALELSITDPHYGMMCFKGESDHSWDLEACEKACMWAIDSLISRAAVYGPFDEIVFPFGNDFLHHDNLFHSTTKGTPQPEAISFHYVYERAITLALAMVDRMTEIAPVKIIQVSGNHDQVATFTLGHVLNAYYRNNKNVSVDVSPSPYKFYKFGTNLIGFDHGHHVKPGRLAALMAHECVDDWANTTFREWHLGDQHRKGSARPVVMEEQGVSVEYLPALTPPNAWHRLKSFNWQQRGAMAFVWDRNEGPLARVQVNLNSYTGKPTGE